MSANGLEQETKTAPGIYGRFWDHYVDIWNQTPEWSEGKRWPGDEWGTPETWDSDFNALFGVAGVGSWKRAVEIGSGSGKYTSKVLESSEAEVRAYDVSHKFMQVCATRCKDWIDRGRLSMNLLGIERASQMLESLEGCGWGRKVDGFYSMDAMVHVDLQYLSVYMLTAGLVLRPGGTLILTVADITNDVGFHKLMWELRGMFVTQSNAFGSSKFEWLSPDIVQSLLPRFGFRVDALTRENNRDLYIRATLVEPERADGLRSFL